MCLASQTEEWKWLLMIPIKRKGEFDDIHLSLSKAFEILSKKGLPQAAWAYSSSKSNFKKLEHEWVLYFSPKAKT